MSLPVPGPAAPGASAPLQGCPTARLEPLTDLRSKLGSYYLCNNFGPPRGLAAILLNTYKDPPAPPYAAVATLLKPSRAGRSVPCLGARAPALRVFCWMATALSAAAGGTAGVSRA